MVILKTNSNLSFLKSEKLELFVEILIHEADPESRPVVIIVFAHVVRSYVRQYVRPSVPTFQNKMNFKRKQCSLLARLWVWPSGSLITPVLFNFIFIASLRICSEVHTRQQT